MTVTAARRRELVDELVNARSERVLADDAPTLPALSPLWGFWLIRAGFEAITAGGERRRELARAVAIVGLAWLEACDEHDQEQPPPA